MKKYIAFIFMISVFFSCKKSNIIPESIKSPTDTNTDASTGPSIGTVKIDIADQVINTSVSNDTLYLNYTETVNLLLNPDDYQKSWAVHVNQDFSKSSLANLDFSTLNKDKQVVYNYLDDNLNNVAIKTASTVTINGKNFIKLVLERAIVFSKAYKQHDLAVEAQNNILKQTKDVISFASYYYLNDQNSATTTTTALVVYKK